MNGDWRTRALPPLTHVGYVTRDMPGAVRSLQAAFGLAEFMEVVPEYHNKVYRGKPGDFVMKLAFARRGDVVYEVIQPESGANIYDDFLRDHGCGLHHLGYDVVELERWTESYSELGIESIMSGQYKGAKWSYFDLGEIVIELVERNPAGVRV